MLDDLALRYVKLVLALGRHDAAYVDAYYGPPGLREEMEAAALGPEDIARQAHELQAALAALAEPAGPLLGRRRRFLAVQARALAARAAMVGGQHPTFDEESALLYDAVAPAKPAETFRIALAQVAELLPGPGSLAERYHAYMAGFVIPRDRLDAVFSRALAESRARTLHWIPLPAEEGCALEYVTDKPWSGYNWYQGGSRSLVQMNTDLPIFLDRAIDLASHEGYPGHHVYNTLLEAELVRKRGWLEFTVYPLFSPQSLIAEGTANFGVELAFPREARTAFEREVLFPLAGLDPAEVERYDALREAVEGLAYASNEAARQYLDGQLTREQAVRWLMDHALATPERAEQRVRFIEANRSYVINYNLGQDLVRRHIGPGTPEQRWTRFAELLSVPTVPSDL